MLNSALFRGFNDVELKKFLKCADSKTKNCNKTETIMSFNGNEDYIYILLRGTAELVCYDYDGNRTILERYTKDSVFGEIFSPYSNSDEVFVVANTPCDVLILKYKKSITQCENNCVAHTRFLHNLFSLIAKKLSLQTHHIEVLSKRTIREKLLTYFEIQATENGTSSFTLPFSLSSLADYLSIDRSAMQREMKKLREEGIITSAGKKVELCNKNL